MTSEVASMPIHQICILNSLICDMWAVGVEICVSTIITCVLYTLPLKEPFC